MDWDGLSLQQIDVAENITRQCPYEKRGHAHTERRLDAQKAVVRST